MSTPTRTRHYRVSLVDPPELEGECPSASCGKGPYPLTDGQVPEHRRGALNDGHRCPCSGWQARNPRPRTHVVPEGVLYL